MGLSPLKNKQIEAYHDKGLTVKEIGRKTHCSHAEIRQLLKSKGKEPIEEKKPVKENEPASAATDTSSQDNNVPHEPDARRQPHPVSTEQYNTTLERCQAALKQTQRELALIYERLGENQQHAWDLGELYHEVSCAVLAAKESEDV